MNMTPNPSDDRETLKSYKLPWATCAETDESGNPYVGLFYKGAEEARFAQGYTAREACIALNEAWKQENGFSRGAAARIAAERDRYREALAELVAVKRLKEMYEAYDSDPAHTELRQNLRADYLARKNKAWDEARAVLSASPAPTTNEKEP